MADLAEAASISEAAKAGPTKGACYDCKVLLIDK